MCHGTLKTQSTREFCMLSMPPTAEEGSFVDVGMFPLHILTKHALVTAYGDWSASY